MLSSPREFSLNKDFKQWTKHEVFSFCSYCKISNDYHQLYLAIRLNKDLGYNRNFWFISHTSCDHIPIGFDGLERLFLWFDKFWKISMKIYQVINSFMTEVSIYRNQPIDMQGKSMDWFLYDRDLRHKRAKEQVFFLYFFFKYIFKIFRTATGFSKGAVPTRFTD